jgi:hypothetical protein
VVAALGRAKAWRKWKRSLAGLLGWRCLSCGVFSSRRLNATVGSFESPRPALSNDGRPRLEGPLLKGGDAWCFLSARNFDARRRGGSGDRQNEM